MIQQQSPSGSPQIKAKMCRYRLHIYINMSKYWLRRNRTTDFSCVLLLHQHDIVALLMKEKQICFNETLLLFINWKLFLEIFITYFSEDLCNWPHFIWQLAMIIIRKQALEVKKTWFAIPISIYVMSDMEEIIKTSRASVCVPEKREAGASISGLSREVIKLSAQHVTWAAQAWLCETKSVPFL